MYLESLDKTLLISRNSSLTVNGRVDYNIDILQSEYGQQQFSVFNYTLGKTQSKLIGSLNTSFQCPIYKNLSMIATVGYSERMPTIGERMGFYLYNAYDGYDYIGNPYIKPEKSNYFNLAFLVSNPKLKVNFTQSFSLVNDYIMGVTNTQIPAMNFYAKGIRVYSNFPSAELYSADLQILYNPIKNFSVFLTSKFTIGELHSGNAMPLIPPLKTVLAFQYQKDHLSFKAEGESAMAQNRINTDYGESITPAFKVFNIKSGYSLLIGKTVMDIGCGITNLLNKVYYEHLDWGRINRPGRSLELLVKLTY